MVSAHACDCHITFGIPSNFHIKNPSKLSNIINLYYILAAWNYKESKIPLNLSFKKFSFKLKTNKLKFLDHISVQHWHKENEFCNFIVQTYVVTLDIIKYKAFIIRNKLVYFCGIFIKYGHGLLINKAQSKNCISDSVLNLHILTQLSESSGRLLHIIFVLHK